MFEIMYLKIQNSNQIKTQLITINYHEKSVFGLNLIHQLINFSNKINNRKRKQENQCKNSMDYIKQKHHKLTHIIKNCKNTQVQLIELKRTLKNESQFDPLNKYPIKPCKSVSLLKSSRVHIDEFEKRQVKMTSFEKKGNFRQRDKILGIQAEPIDCKEKELRFKKIITCPKGSQTIETNHLQSQYQNQTQPVTPSSSKQKKQTESYLPNIQGAYLHTFSPKNASLSQYSLAVKQLERSVHKKQHEERCKKYNKENILREYQNRKHLNDQKLEMHRLNILKKISCENVKKYLINKVQDKGKYASIDRQQRALYRSYHERA